MAGKLVVALAAAGAASVSLAAGASPGAGGYEPALRASDFAPVVTNRYFPLPVGRTWVYTGTKDGASQTDTVTVLARAKVVAEGIRARVVRDVARHGAKVLERTFDWYAQDRKGNVWYVGEDTKAYLANGTVDRSGSWEAGVHDAEPGLIMEAAPKVPDAYRQEYLRGQAEDTAWVVARGGSVAVPYGRVRRVLTTLEASRLEPGLYDEKVYAPGVGIVLERALTGPRETARLVRMNG